MDKDETIKFLVKQNDFILNVNRTLKLKNFIKNIAISGSLLLNVYLLHISKSWIQSKIRPKHFCRTLISNPDFSFEEVKRGSSVVFT